MSGTAAPRVPPWGLSVERGMLRVGRVAGAPVVVSWTWLLVPLFTVAAFRDAVAVRAGTGDGPVAVALALAVALLLLVAVVLHEIGHAVAARAAGLPVHRVVVDVFGGHTTFRAPAGPRVSALTALAGPAVNVLLAGLALAVGRVVPAAREPGAGALAEYLLGLFLAVNVVLAVFNLLPGLPLDGGRVLEGLLWWATGRREVGTLVAAWGGRLLALALVGLAVLLVTSGSPSLLTLAVLVLVAWSLWRGSSQALQHAEVRRRAAELAVAAVVAPVPSVPAVGSVAEFVAALGEQGLPPQTGAVLVDPGGRPVAVVGAGTVSGVPTERWESTPLSAVSRILPAVALVPADGRASQVLAALGEVGGTGLLAVDDAGRLVGVIDETRLAAVLNGPAGRKR